MRKFLFFAILGALFVLVFYSTESPVVALFAVGVFLVVWILQANTRSVVFSRRVKIFLQQNSIRAEFPNHSDFAEGYLIYKDYVGAAGICISDKGVHLYSAWIIECLIPWESISAIKIVDRGRHTLFDLAFISGDEVLVPYSELLLNDIKNKSPKEKYSSLKSESEFEVDLI